MGILVAIRGYFWFSNSRQFTVAVLFHVLLLFEFLKCTNVSLRCEIWWLSSIKVMCDFTSYYVRTNIKCLNKEMNLTDHIPRDAENHRVRSETQRYFCGIFWGNLFWIIFVSISIFCYNLLGSSRHRCVLLLLPSILQFIPTTLTLDSGVTRPPPLLSEADLLNCMDKVKKIIANFIFQSNFWIYDHWSWVSTAVDVCCNSMSHYLITSSHQLCLFRLALALMPRCMIT